MLTDFHNRKKHSAVQFCTCDLHCLPSYHAFCEKEGELQGTTVKSHCYVLPCLSVCVCGVDASLTEKVFGYRK